MNDRTATVRTSDDVPCGFPWCTTAHGRTTHPADEDHRSAGRTVAFDLVDGRRRIEAEVGLLRRRGEGETWLVLEDGADVDVRIPVVDARAVLRALAADPDVAAELGLAGEPPRASRSARS